MGSSRGPYFFYFYLLARQHFRESQSSVPSLPFFINKFRFSDWVLFLRKEVGHDLKPINNLLILSLFLYLSISL